MIRNKACQSATGKLKHTFSYCLCKWHMPRHSVMIRFEAWCKMRYLMIFHICLIRIDDRTIMLLVFATLFDRMEQPWSIQWWLHDIFTFSIFLSFLIERLPVGYPKNKPPGRGFGVFFFCPPEKPVDQTVELVVTSGALIPIWRRCDANEIWYTCSIWRILFDQM